MRATGTQKNFKKVLTRSRNHGIINISNKERGTEMKTAIKKDNRKNYYLMLDTETANGLDDPFVYDIGLAVVDKKGNVYHTDSLIIHEIFYGEEELMRSAYYANKRPLYYKKMKNKEIRVVTFETARKIVAEIMKEWDIHAIVSHNGRFDYNALNTTSKFLTNSRKRSFFPYGTKFYDTMRMAESVILPMKSYKAFCEKLPEVRLLKNGRPRKTAEILYQFLIDDDEFEEEHTGLADCMIEKEIMSYCFRQKKKMVKNTFKNNGKKVTIKNTELQWKIYWNARYQGVKV